MQLKSWQFICPDCGKITDTGGTGQRLRCRPCAEKRHKAQQKAWHEANNFYEHKRGPHSKLKGKQTT